MDLCNLSVIRDLMSDAGITFRKEFGQNFLTNRMIPEDIADNCTDNAESMILEIGPGIGCLTQELALRYARVVAVEIDKGLLPILDKTLAPYPNASVVNADVMELDLAAVLEREAEGRDIVVCANLPYYITTPILMKLLESGLPFHNITVMIQSEVADRLCSPVGGKDCGAITAVLNYYGAAERLFVVPASDFLPPPSVNSAVVRIRLHDKKPFVPKDDELFRKTIRVAFEQRRKTLPNALQAGFGNLSKEECIAAVEAAGLRPDIRGERLTMQDFVTLADILNEKLSGAAE